MDVVNTAVSQVPRLLFCAYLVLTPGAFEVGAQNIKGEVPVATATLDSRLFLWGHPAGVYDSSYTKNLRPSKIEPVDAADCLDLRNMYFIRCDGNPALPFEDYFKPFEKLDRVLWSLTGAAGVTSQAEREAAFQLAADHENIVGFIMDDFFHADASIPKQWLAANQVSFPVVVSFTPPQPVVADRLTLAQSSWPSGDYRAKEIALEVTHDGNSWQETQKAVLPNEAVGKVELQIHDKPLKGLRLNILSSHDKSPIASCGLSTFQLSQNGEPIDFSQWQATASSSHSGYSPTALIVHDWPVPASLDPKELRQIRERLTIGKRQLKLSVVVYSTQISTRAKHHLQYVDEITLWTWRPEDLDYLETNLTQLEDISPDKSIVLGCYMYDFSRNKPLSVERMKQQVELGHRWLNEGRIQGMIFLASPLCDLDLDAVEWTREWIAKSKRQPINHRP